MLPVIEAPPVTVLAQIVNAEAPADEMLPDTDDPPATNRAPPDPIFIEPLTVSFESRQSDCPDVTVWPPVTLPESDVVHPTEVDVVVSLPVMPGGPGFDAIVARIGEASLALYEELLELG